MHNVIRPLDRCPQAELLHRTCNRNRRHQCTFRRILRKKIRPQKNAHIDALAGRREKRALHTSAPHSLRIRNDNGAVFCPLARHILQQQVRRADGIIADDFSPHELCSKPFCNLRFDQTVRCGAQNIAAARRTRNIIAGIPQRRDLLPHGCPRHAEPLRHLLSRYIAACFAQELQYIAPHRMPPIRKAIIRLIIQQIMALCHKKIWKNINRILCAASANKPLVCIQIQGVNRNIFQ